MVTSAPSGEYFTAFDTRLPRIVFTCSGSARTRIRLAESTRIVRFVGPPAEVLAGVAAAEPQGLTREEDPRQIRVALGIEHPIWLGVRPFCLEGRWLVERNQLGTGELPETGALCADQACDRLTHLFEERR
jgi:hypothetical protein